MSKYVIKGIVPFNDIYYVNCAQVSYYSVIRSLNCNYHNFMANDFFYYAIEEKNKGFVIKFEIALKKTVDELSLQNGIIVKKDFTATEDLIPYIEENISKNKILLVAIDMMHYKHSPNDLFYMKEHHGESFLVYGFDSMKKTLQIVGIDATQWDKNNFSYCQELGYSEVTDCYDSFLKNLLTIEYTTGSYYKDESFVAVQPDLKECVIEYLRENKQKLYKGLDDLKWMFNNIDQYEFDNLNTFTNRACSLANLYKYKSIMKESWDKYYDSFAEIYNRWYMIDYLQRKLQMLGNIRDKSKLAKKMEEIYNIESLLYDEIYRSI